MDQQQLRTRLDDLVARQRPDRRGPSAVLAIESLDGAFTWSAGAGPASVRDASPIDTTSPYFAASITKLYVAVLTLQLRRDGLLGLDTPLVEVVPYDLAGLHVIGGVDRTGELTIGQALAHTTGLPNYLEDSVRGRDSLLDQALAADRSWGLDQVIDRSRTELGAKFEPGRRKRAHYSDTNYQLLGAAIEHVTGQSLDEVLRERICGPLGARSTHLFDPDRDDVDAVATLFNRRQQLRHPLLLGSVGADGGVVTTAGESLVFLRSLLSGELLTTADLEAMQATWRRIFFPFRYGLGVMRFRLPRALTGFRNLTLVGHSGASGALLFFAPEQELLVAGTVNQLEPRSVGFRLALRALGMVASSR
jgi:CubicO group peptidase (beta-lactamase class C family)